MGSLFHSRLPSSRLQCKASAIGGVRTSCQELASRFEVPEAKMCGHIHPFPQVRSPIRILSHSIWILGEVFSSHLRRLGKRPHFYAYRTVNVATVWFISLLQRKHALELALQFGGARSSKLEARRGTKAAGRGGSRIHDNANTVPTSYRLPRRATKALTSSMMNQHYKLLILIIIVVVVSESSG